MPKFGTKFSTMEVYPIKRKERYLYCVDGKGYVWEVPNRHVLREQKAELKAAAEKIRATATPAAPTTQ